MIRACFSTHLTFQRHMNTLKSIRCKLKPFSWEENLKQKMPNKHPKLDIQPIILCTAHLLLAPKAVKIKPCSKMLNTLTKLSLSTPQMVLIVHST